MGRGNNKNSYDSRDILLKNRVKFSVPPGKTAPIQQHRPGFSTGEGVTRINESPVIAKTQNHILELLERIREEDGIHYGWFCVDCLDVYLDGYEHRVDNIIKQNDSTCYFCKGDIIKYTDDNLYRFRKDILARREALDLTKQTLEDETGGTDILEDLSFEISIDTSAWVYDVGAYNDSIESRKRLPDGSLERPKPIYDFVFQADLSNKTIDLADSFETENKIMVPGLFFEHEGQSCLLPWHEIEFVER